MLNSMEESARAWFLKTLDIGQTVRVPKCKGKGKVIAISATLLVDMLDGPYFKQRFELEWSDIARLS